MRERECRAVIEIKTRDAVHLVNALQPDNSTAPSHMSVKCIQKFESLECTIIVRDCLDPRRILTMRNTVDDLLYSLRAALEAIRQQQ